MSTGNLILDHLIANSPIIAAIIAVAIAVILRVERLEIKIARIEGKMDVILHRSNGAPR